MGVSASQIRLWQRCPRLYTDTYVRNLREPEKPATPAAGPSSIGRSNCGCAARPGPRRIRRKV